MTALYLLFRGYINERMFVNLYKHGFFLSSVRPHPIAHLRHILEVRPHIFCVPGEQVVALCYQRWGECSHACGSSHGLDTEMIATHMVQHDHIKRRGSRPLFHKPAHMETRRVGSSMNNFMNGSRIPIECKNHRRINRKVLDEGSIIQAMRMQEWRGRVSYRHDVTPPALSLLPSI